MLADVLFAHEIPPVVSAVRHVLGAHGYRVDAARDGDEAREKLGRDIYAALVVDAALPGVPVYALVSEAKMWAEQGRGAPVVVLVSSVFRRSSYKRKPLRLYGADEHIELHEVGRRLCPVLERSGVKPSQPPEQSRDRDVLARRIVADLVLFHGVRILEARTNAEILAVIEPDLASAREILDPNSASFKESSPFDDAFHHLMRAMGRETEVRS